MTTRPRLSSFAPPCASRPRALARHARARRPHGRAICAAMLCAAHLCVDATSARKPRAPKAASTPSTAQILAPSAATVPDALPADKAIYRCGNTYSTHACSDTKPLDVADARSDAQRRQAADLTVRDKRLASWYEAGRRERETVASGPASTRRAAAGPQCVSNTVMTCVPKKPRSRNEISTAASAATLTKLR